MPESLYQNLSSDSRQPGNPFPGLRPFTPAESHLFFGRERQGESILKQLNSHRFVALIGASGSGKSSLIYCGLVAGLNQGGIKNVVSQWHVITTHPGNDPVGNLAQGIVNSLGLKGDQLSYQSELRSKLYHHDTGIHEILKSALPSAPGNFLLIIDQFEELFRYADENTDPSQQNDADIFVSLLVESVRKQALPIYVVLTMRSDFIGDCSRFQDLTSLINQSNYLIPRMSRSDLELAITGP